ncbi:hypothetical protein PIB30_091252, partial [Stylosanthes scabra]|nr:hypothetical protein [Stylosanthes scabra]
KRFHTRLIALEDKGSKPKSYILEKIFLLERKPAVFRFGPTDRFLAGSSVRIRFSEKRFLVLIRTVSMAGFRLNRFGRPIRSDFQNYTSHSVVVTNISDAGGKASFKNLSASAFKSIPTLKSQEQKLLGFSNYQCKESIPSHLVFPLLPTVVRPTHLRAAAAAVSLQLVSPSRSVSMASNRRLSLLSLDLTLRIPPKPLSPCSSSPRRVASQWPSTVASSSLSLEVLASPPSSDLTLSACPSVEGTFSEKTKHLGLRNRIEKKAAYLQELEEQVRNAYSLMIYFGNELWSLSVFRTSYNGMSNYVAQEMVPVEVYLCLFILVQTRPHATVEVEISEDMQLVLFDFNRYKGFNCLALYILSERMMNADCVILCVFLIIERPELGPPSSPPLPGILKARVKLEH